MCSHSNSASLNCCIEQAIMWVMEHMADPGRIGSSCVLILTVLFSIDALSRPLCGSWST